MISRKNFLITGAISVAALTILGKAMGVKMKVTNKLKKTKPATALVVWYSQTGNTERIGKAIAQTWKKAGLKVNSGDYRDIEKETIDKYDIIAAGTPVHYYEVPPNFKKWLESIPRIDGKPVAVFVSFGGEGGNQYNTACELIKSLVQKGGVRAGNEQFSCMSSFSFTWSSGNISRILKYSDRPNNETYKAAKNFALEIISRVKQGEVINISGKFDLRNIIKGSPSIGATKLLMTGHKVNKEKCISCWKCKRACTVNAINPESGTVNTDKCIACLGCINNCPANAVEMKFAGKEVYGYREFIKRNNIKLNEPEIL